MVRRGSGIRREGHPWTSREHTLQSIYAATDKFLDSVAVLRYTVPAQKRGEVLSLYDYLRETGLQKHFLMMPSSAQRCFLFSGLNCCSCLTLLTAAIMLAVKSVKSLVREENKA